MLEFLALALLPSENLPSGRDAGLGLQESVVEGGLGF